MKTLCVVTAVWDGKHEWLVELGLSISKLRDGLPDDWDLVWAVQEDGDAGTHKKQGAFLDKMFDFCRYDFLGVRLGAAVCRNVALSRVPEANAVTNFDCDDVVGVEGMLHSVRLLDESENKIVWIVGATDDWFEDGSRTTVMSSLLGNVEAGVVPELWWEKQRLPFHTIGFMARAQEWRAVGGWLAQPTMADDTAGVMATTQLWDGVVHQKVTGLWRRHTNQNSSKKTRYLTKKHLGASYAKE